MGGYIANFTVYTMAMTGLICFAVFIYKKITDGSMHSNNTKFLSIEDSMSINPRKTLHVVRAGNEKFLIASDIDRTTLISKLEWNKTPDLRNLERFREIPPAEQITEIIRPTKANDTPIPNSESVQVEKKVVHLDMVDPARRRTQSRQRKINVQTEKLSQTTKTPSGWKIETPQERGFSPMKEMAKRINEL